MTPWVTAERVARAYLVFALIFSVLFSSLLQLGVALVLLAVQLYLAYKPLNADLNLILIVGSLVFAPLALEALAGVYAVLLVVPGLFLLDRGLKDFALTQVFSFRRIGRGGSDVLRALSIGLLSTLVISAVVWNLTLILTSAVLMGYLAVMVAFILHEIPKAPLQADKSWSRILVGDTQTRTVTIRGKINTPILVSLQPVDSWVDVEPANFVLPAKREINATVRFTPPLAGPSKIRLKASVVDARGLVQTGKIIEPLDLHIIPKAKYAQWLASKYLTQTSAGLGMTVDIPTPGSRATKSGVEFHGSRPYQSGDRLRDIDWRHSHMLGELIVKEFAGAQGQIGVIAADLTAKDTEDADKLAYNFVMTALTLAVEALPSALAIYNKKEVLSVTQPMNPRETLRKTLELTEKITIAEVKEKVLQPTQMLRLKRSMGQLAQVQTESAQKLLKLLEFEFGANEEAAKGHPSALALAKAVKSIQGPAVITVVSMMDDCEALLLTLERLREKGYSTVMVGSEGRKHANPRN